MPAGCKSVLSLLHSCKFGVSNRTGCEVGVAVCWDDQAEIHETRSNDFVVHQNAADIFRRDPTF